MQTYNNLYPEIYSIKNLVIAWRKARKGKTKRAYVLEFEKNLGKNIKSIHEELKTKTYSPKPLKTFILRDPKTRKISKSHFRDRIAHHAITNVLEPIFEKMFIEDNCACRKNKGTLFALDRFKKFQRKVTKNLSSYGCCLKADIKHYFKEIDHKILLQIIKKKVKDLDVLELIEKILKNNVSDNLKGKGMPLGNITSQFLANVYLNEFDYFVKHELKVKFYIRYVDDFVLLDSSREQLIIRFGAIEQFLNENLKLELNKDKSKIIYLSKGVDFVGFRNFYHFRLLRKRNIRKIHYKIKQLKNNKISREKFKETFEGWSAYAKWANSYRLRERLLGIELRNV